MALYQTLSSRTLRITSNLSRAIHSPPETRSFTSTPTRKRSTREPAYPGHIPLNWIENAFLAAGSAVMSLVDPRRHDLIAALGETTAGPALPRLRDIMLESSEGRRILKDRPRINSSTIDLSKLSKLPEGSLGKTYTTWLERTGATPDTREPVHYIDDPELAYIMQRYRESHDFYHALLGFPVDLTSELIVKAFEFANLGLPMTALSLTASLRLVGSGQKKREKRERLAEMLPWAVKCGGNARSLITVYWEERWETDVREVKRELGVSDPPRIESDRWPLKRRKDGEGSEVKHESTIVDVKASEPQQPPSM